LITLAADEDDKNDYHILNGRRHRMLQDILENFSSGAQNLSLVIASRMTAQLPAPIAIAEADAAAAKGL
jgi:hypothetical protein